MYSVQRVNRQVTPRVITWTREIKAYNEWRRDGFYTDAISHDTMTRAITMTQMEELADPLTTYTKQGTQALTSEGKRSTYRIVNYMRHIRCFYGTNFLIRYPLSYLCEYTAEEFQWRQPLQPVRQFTFRAAIRSKCQCEMSRSHGWQEKNYYFWDVASCSLIVVDRRFRCLLSQSSWLTFLIRLLPPASDRPDEGGRKHLWNVGKLLPDHTVQRTRSQSSLRLSTIHSRRSVHYFELKFKRLVGNVYTKHGAISALRTQSLSITKEF
jgi:hypothetical protein